MERYELVIVGGGMAGLTLLAKIAPAIEAGLSVALIDPAAAIPSADNHSPSFDDRATALSAATIRQLAQLNMPMLDTALTNITDIEVSDQHHLGFHHMSAAAQGENRFGAVIANRALGALLVEHTQSISATRYQQTTVTKLTPTATGQQLTLSNHTKIDSQLVILCDGGRSNLAANAGLTSNSFAFNAHARVATVKTTEAHQGRAFERFTAQGPIALLPFGEFSTLVWTVTNKDAPTTPQTASDALPWLNEKFGQRLGRITEISDWFEYPLTERRLTRLVAHGVLALGNTAATLHPVAGQGFNLAMRGIARSAQCINQHYLSNQALPTFNQLNELASTIQADQTTTANLSRELIQLFASRNPAVQLARGIGLGSLDRHPWLSHCFALAGMGYFAKPASAIKLF